MKIKFIITFIILLLSNKIFANLSAPPEPSPGNIAGESRMKDISVLHEDLSINLSNIINNNGATIRAKYKIKCLNIVKNLDLVFVANNLKENDYRIKLNNEIIIGEIAQYDSTPDSWLPPDSISWKNEKIPYIYTNKGLISFTLEDIPIGEHVLDISYEAHISEWFNRNDLSRFRTFVYILKPAANWRNFKNLNIDITFPFDWEYSANIKFEKQADNILHGYWEKIPADYLSIVLKPPEARARQFSLIFQFFSWLIFTVLSVFWMILIIRIRKNGFKYKAFRIINYILISFLCAVFYYFIYLTNDDVLNLFLDGHLNPFETRRSGVFLAVFPIVWFLFGIIVFIINFVLKKFMK